MLYSQAKQMVPQAIIFHLLLGHVSYSTKNKVAMVAQRLILWRSNLDVMIQSVFCFSLHIPTLAQKGRSVACLAQFATLRTVATRSVHGICGKNTEGLPFPPPKGSLNLGLNLPTPALAGGNIARESFTKPC